MTVVKEGMLFNCTRRLAFDYGHRLMNHGSLCKHTHGHRGVVEVKCASAQLDKVGRVIDFGDIKRIVGGWIDEHWDHSFLVNKEDLVMREFLAKNEQRHYVFPGEPSAENICAHFASQAAKLLLPCKIMLTKVRFYETENNWAEWEIPTFALERAALDFDSYAKAVESYECNY